MVNTGGLPFKKFSLQEKKERLMIQTYLWIKDSHLFHQREIHRCDCYRAIQVIQSQAKLKLFNALKLDVFF